MSFTPCGGITQNITNNCQPRIKGFEQLGLIRNKIANSDAYAIYQLRQNPKPFNSYKVEFQPDTNIYKKTIQFYFDGIGAANAKNVVDSLKDNEFMIVIERKEKLHYENRYIFIGVQNVLHVTEMVEDEETGYWLITMETEEPAGEISFSNFQMEGFVNGENVEY